MLHLLPIRIVVKTLLGLTLALALLAIDSGVIVPETWSAKIRTALPLIALIDAAILAAAYFLWYRIPGFQTYVFPHLAGDWQGEIHYRDPLTNAKQVRPAKLVISQNLFEIRLRLKTDFSTSDSVIVHPVKDVGFNEFKLLYIFQNHRHETAPYGAASYRGAAIMTYLSSPVPKLEGDYFTDEQRRGHVFFQRD